MPVRDLLTLLRIAFFLAVTAAVAAAGQAATGPARQFRARLAPVPIDLVTQAAITGRGTATATLTDAKLTITGTFTDLKSPATVARVHVGPKGIRGPAVFDLTVSKSTAGTLAGSFDLTAEHIDDLRNGRLYLQLHSKEAPEGNLWGWLLPPPARR